MKARKWIYLGAAVAVLLVAAAAVAAVLATSGSDGSAREAAKAVAGKGGSAKTEAIKVHGQWTIEVRRSDGTLVSRRQFENALMPQGAFALSAFLSRTNSVGRWRLAVGHTSNIGPSPCTDTFFCLIGEADDPGGGLETGSNLFKTLTVSAPSGFAFPPVPDAGKLVLSGSLVAQQTSSITNVISYASQCAASNPPSTPCGTGGTLFTSRDLASAVNVQSGQQVLVTVKISFS